MNRQEYQAYEDKLAEFVRREGLSFLSTSTAEECGGPDADAWFSGQCCDACRADAGMREYLYARNADGRIVRFEICSDCVQYVNYGRLDDLTMLAIESDQETLCDVRI